MISQNDEQTKGAESGQDNAFCLTNPLHNKFGVSDQPRKKGYFIILFLEKNKDSILLRDQK